MSTAPINNQASPPVVSNSQGVAQAGGKTKGSKTSMLIICALLLQETVNTCVKSTSTDSKGLDSESVLMKNLDARERNLGHWKLVVATKHHHEWHTYTSPSLIHHWGWFTHTKNTVSNVAAAANSIQKGKQVSAEKQQIAGSFGEAQTACQAPETKLGTDVNNIQQAEQQGLGILIKFQQLTLAALQKRPS